MKKVNNKKSNQKAKRGYNHLLAKSISIYKLFVNKLLPALMAPYILATLGGMLTGHDTKIYEIINGHKYGPDHRTKAPTIEQLVSPVVQIKVLHERGGGNCTAAAVAPMVFVTAAHCLNKGVREIQLSRGNATGTHFTTKKYVVHNKYDGSIKYDIGLIITDNPIADYWFEPTEFPKNYKNLTVETAGYPGDKPRGTMWTSTFSGFHKGRSIIGGKFSNSTLSSPGKSYGGQSGSPIYQLYENIYNLPDTPTFIGKTYGVLVYRSNSYGTNKKYFSIFKGFSPKDVDWIEKTVIKILNKRNKEQHYRS